MTMRHTIALQFNSWGVKMDEKEEAAEKQESIYLKNLYIYI